MTRCHGFLVGRDRLIGVTPREVLDRLTQHARQFAFENYLMVQVHCLAQYDRRHKDAAQFLVRAPRRSRVDHADDVAYLALWHVERLTKLNCLLDRAQATCRQIDGVIGTEHTRAPLVSESRQYAHVASPAAVIRPPSFHVAGFFDVNSNWSS